MLFVAFFSWWYGAGWHQRVDIVRHKLAAVADIFSIGLLARTLFMPFRQISAGRVDGPLGVQFRAWLDKLVSRVIGALVRIVTILAGVVVLLLTVLWGVALIVLWPLLPVLPVVAFIVFILGGVPL